MSGNTIEYLIRLKDDFTSKMQSAANVGKKGGAAIAEGMAVAVAAGVQFKDQISAGWDVLNGNYEKLGTVLGALPGPIGVIGETVGTAFGSMIKDAETAVEGYRKLSAATGESIEFLSGFKEAADDVRVSGESVDAALTKFARGLGGVKDASDGVAENGKGIAATLKDIGVAAGDSEGKVRPLSALLPDVAEAFSKMADGPQKTAIAIQLFGKQGAELVPILNKGRDGLKEMMQAADAAGLTFGTSTLKAVDRLKVAQDQLGDSVESLRRRMAVGVIPTLAKAVDEINFLTGGQDTLRQKSLDAHLALLEFAKSGDISAATMDKLKKGGIDTKQVLLDLASAPPPAKVFGIFPTTDKYRDAAIALREIHPELFQLSDESDKAAMSADALAEAQKKVAEGSVEYKDRTQQLTDAMSKRDSQLAEVQKKEETLTQAHEKGFITSEQYAKGMAYLQDQTGKVRDTFESAAGKIHDGVQATEAMDKAAGNATQRERDFEQATKDAAAAQAELKGKLDDLTTGVGQMPEKLDKAKLAMLAFKLATGQSTGKDVETQFIGSALTQQFVKGAIDLKEFTRLTTEFYKGAITGEQALQQAGAWKSPNIIATAKQIREAEGAAGVANKTELEHADFIELSTRRGVAQKKTLDDVAEAQAGVNAQQRQNEEQDKKNKAALDNKTISEKDYIKAQIQGNEALDQTNENLRKTKASYEAKSGAVTYSTTVIDKYAQHLWDTGKAAQDVGTALGAIPDTAIKVTSDTSGFVTPLKNAKVEAEQPVTVPVEYKFSNAPSFGTDKPAPNSSMTLPVAFDTAGLDKQAAAVKDELTKLGPAGVSISLDTISFDQTLLRVKADLATLPDKSVSIGASAPLGGFTNSSITVSVIGDTEKATTAIQEVVDIVIPEKVAFINGDSLGAMTILDDVNNAIVKSKTLVIAGVNTDGSGASGGVATSKSMPFALDAVAAVNAADIPLKKLIIAGDNTHAMQAIGNTKTAMDSLKDKTVYLTVVNKVINEKMDDNGGGGGGSGKDNRIPSTALRDESANGTGKVIYLTQTFHMKDDEMTAAVIKRVVREELSAILNK